MNQKNARDLFYKQIEFFLLFKRIFGTSLWRCTGEKGNVCFELAKGKNLLQRGVEKLGISNLIRSNGEQIPSELATKLIDLSLEILNDESEERLNYKGPLGNFFAEK